MAQLATDAVLEESPDLAPIAARIARVAARLFAERGFDATSVREIAEASGVTKPTLYYHFGSKQGLGEAILTRPMAQMARRLAAIAGDEVRGANPIGLLETIFQLNLDFVVDDPDRSRFLYAVCFGPVGSGFRDEVHQFGQTFDLALRAAATRLVNAGIMADDRVEAFVQVARGLIMSSTLDHIFLCQAIGDGAAARLVSDLLNGFARTTGRIESKESQR